jgi:hypothetical protein
MGEQYCTPSGGCKLLLGLQGLREKVLGYDRGELNAALISYDDLGKGIGCIALNIVARISRPDTKAVALASASAGSSMPVSSVAIMSPLRKCRISAWRCSSLPSNPEQN